MRITQSLWRQHLGRMIKKHWVVQGQRVPQETGAAALLEAQGIQVLDPQEVVIEKRSFQKIEVERLVPMPPPRDSNHPDWKDKPCLTYRDHNVLLEGVEQAKILIKTIEINNELPERVQSLVKDHSEQVENLVHRAIRASNIFDAHQELLPKKKDPNRPTYVFPRILGLTDLRKIRNLSQKLIQLCESISDPNIVHERSLVHNGVVSVPIEKDEDQLQFILRADLMVTSANPLKPVGSKNDGKDMELPDLYPMQSTITLNKEYIYTLRNLYPVDSKSPWMNAHTIFVHCNHEEIKNLFELPVSETQILARSMLKSFAVAAACARQRFGESCKDLPEPVTIQCIQSDGKLFHFSVFQLNTLDLNRMEGTKNLWWSCPRINLFEKAQFENGKPVFKGYNPEVFKRIFAFYNNN